MSGMTTNIIIVLLILGSVTWLQVYFSKKDNKFLGLILPSMTLFYSIFMIMSVIAGNPNYQSFSFIGTNLLIANIPTVIFIAIYFFYKNKLKNKGLDKKI